MNLRRGNGKVKDFIKKMETQLSRHHFNEEDSVRILDFLARFKRENRSGDVKGAGLRYGVIIPGRVPLSQYDAMVDVTQWAEGGITFWSEAVQYLLASYAQAIDIWK